MTVATLLLLIAFVSLGRWQWQRGADKQVLWDAFARGSDAASPLDARGLDDMARFARIRVSGRYAPQRQFLLDNRTLRGRAGYEVLTPFELADGRVVIVNRGWIASSGDRTRLPSIDFAAPPVSELLGRVDELPAAGLASGRAPPPVAGPWPRVTSFPQTTELAASLGARLEPRVLLLDAGEPHGYAREWRPPGMEPVKHTSYAVQWWSFAVVLLVLYVGLNLRKPA
jgi:cytochrome oxidase assembly protein ShyY1